MKLSLIAGVTGLTLGIVGSSLAWAALASHPELSSAHQQVQAALKTLGTAHNGKKFFGGHLEEAERLLGKSLTEISEAAEYADKHPAGK